MANILVTGAGGNVGGEAVRALLTRKFEVVAAYYRSNRVSGIFGDSIITSHIDFNDRSTWAD